MKTCQRRARGKFFLPGTSLFFVLFFLLNCASQRCATAFITVSRIPFSPTPLPPSHCLILYGLYSTGSGNNNDIVEDSIAPPPLTVILPAYNESLRIEETLRSYHGFLSSSQKWQQSSQILVVDDGSTDGTRDVVEAVSATLASTLASSLASSSATNQRVTVSVECISLDCNRGKGEAVAQGIQHVSDNYSSKLVLIADADASADISRLDNMYHGLCILLSAEDGQAEIAAIDTSFYDWSKSALVVGRRTDRLSQQQDDTNDTITTSATKGALRQILRTGFRTAVRSLCGDLGVSDTQCGFKLMTLAGGLEVYSDLHLQGWSHDVEVMYRARRKNIPVTERDVLWEDKAGSKLVTSAGGTVGVSLKMLSEIAQLRPLYFLGIWK